MGAVLPHPSIRPIGFDLSAISPPAPSCRVPVFALAILFQNGMEIDDDQFRELISGSLTSVFGSDILNAVAHEERIRKALISAVNEDDEEEARKAAEVLLDQPVPLEEELYARCKTLVLNNTGGAIRSLWSSSKG